MAHPMSEIVEQMLAQLTVRRSTSFPGLLDRLPSLHGRIECLNTAFPSVGSHPFLVQLLHSKVCTLSSVC